MKSEYEKFEEWLSMEPYYESRANLDEELKGAMWKTWQAARRKDT